MRYILVLSIIYFIQWVLFAKSEDTIQYLLALICAFIIIFNLIKTILNKIKN